MQLIVKGSIIIIIIIRPVETAAAASEVPRMMCTSLVAGWLDNSTADKMTSLAQSYRARIS